MSIPKSAPAVTQHTLEVHATEGGRFVLRPRHQEVWTVAQCSERQDAEDIAVCVNSHALLLEALAQIVEEAGPQFGHDGGPGTINKIAFIARAAIREAGAA